MIYRFYFENIHTLDLLESYEKVNQQEELKSSPSSSFLGGDKFIMVSLDVNNTMKERFYFSSFLFWYTLKKFLNIFWDNIFPLF